MINPIPRAQQLKHAALLRENILGCVKAAPDGMTTKEVMAWPSVSQLVRKEDDHKVYMQLRGLEKAGYLQRRRIQHSGSSQTHWTHIKKGATVLPTAAVTAEEELHLRVDRARHELSFQFRGLRIRIEVV